MSEYQYYEFSAVEGPISDEGLRYARGCSSRANVSRVRWQNTYSPAYFAGRHAAVASSSAFFVRLFSLMIYVPSLYSTALTERNRSLHSFQYFLSKCSSSPCL